LLKKGINNAYTRQVMLLGLLSWLAFITDAINNERMPMSSLKILLLCFLVCYLLSGCSQPVEEPATPPQSTEAVNQVETIIERGIRLELDTSYVAPPGDPMSHHTMGFARTLCSAVFVTGLDANFAAENVGYFTAPYEFRDVVAKREVDYDSKVVHLTMKNGVVRSARFVGDLGCVPLPLGESDPYYDPPEIVSSLPDPSITPWPLGDVVAANAAPADVDPEKVAQAVEKVFTSEAMTAAFVVTYKGQIIAERYADGIDMHTPLESWSMAKSLSATLMGVLIHEGEYELWQPAPIPEWQADGDLRQEIRIADILRMSSGLRCRNASDPGYDPELGYPDHLYLYTGTVNSYEYAATRPQQWKPDTVGRYRNCDPVLTNYLIRLAVEGRGDEYHQFPQQHLFDKTGVRNLVFQTDPYGNILLQGSDLGAARDWARLGNLYLNDGVVNGVRILPEGYADFVSTLAPAWVADGRPIYGAFFWLHGTGYGMPPSGMYAMRGAGGQMTMIIPSRHMVIARLGHYKGAPAWRDVEPGVLRLLLDAVPAD
jgi:CubicO group peptidase (beta-lactamase class C family)